MWPWWVRATSACPWRCGPWRSGSTSSGSTSTPTGSPGSGDGRTYIDDVSDADIAAALASGRFLPTTDPADLAGFDVAVVTVPTPLRDGAPDLRHVEDAAR